MTLTLDDAAARFPRRFEDSVLVMDAHTAGEPLRIFVDGGPASKIVGFQEPSGTDMLQKRAWAQAHADKFRRQMMLEPRGHADMYGCWLVEPVTEDGDIGVLFLHNEGFSTMCGHGIIGLVTAGLTYGLFTTAEQDIVKIDTPAGRVTARALRRDGQVGVGRIERVAFLNVPSFVLFDGQVDVSDQGVGEQQDHGKSRNQISFHLAFGGAFYAYVDANEIGLSLDLENSAEIIRWGKRIKRCVSEQFTIQHPESSAQGGTDDNGLDFLYGVIFTDTAQAADVHSRNVCIFADGELDRSPTGTGVSGRAAIEVANGRLRAGPGAPSLVIESILGTSFSVSAKSTTTVGVGDEARSAIIPEVVGSAYVTGINELLIDPSDPLSTGFLIR